MIALLLTDVNEQWVIWINNENEVPPMANLNEEIQRLKHLSGLCEATVRTVDPEMDEYYADKDEEDAAMADGYENPNEYVVGWSAQLHEWYGDDEPGVGNGRYKQKGDGGRVVAINVPDHGQAAQIEDELTRKLNAEDHGEYGDYQYLTGIETFVVSTPEFNSRFWYGKGKDREFDQGYYDFETRGAKDFKK